MKTENTLTKIEITGGSNGYPEPHLGNALIDFDTFEEAQKFADANDTEVCLFHQRDGWHSWENQGTIYRPLTDSDLFDNMGENYYPYTKEDEANYRERIAEMSEDESLEDIKQAIENLIELKEEAEKAGEDMIVIVYENRYYETIDRVMMSCNHDTHQYAIGVPLY